MFAKLILKPPLPEGNCSFTQQSKNLFWTRVNENSPVRRGNVGAVFAHTLPRKCRVSKNEILSLRRRPARSEAERT
jgi:hypothetical protein